MKPRTRLRVLTAAVLWAVAPLRTVRAQASRRLNIAAVQQDSVSWVAARLLTDLYRQAGLSLSLTMLPAPRAGLMAQMGDFDGELVRSPSYGQRHPKLLRIDPPYYGASVHAYGLAQRQAPVRSLEDLRQRSVGAIRGLSYVPDLTEGHPALTLTQGAPQLFRMLQAGRIDAILMTDLTARHVIGSLGLRDITASPALAWMDLHHYLHPRHEALAQQLSEVIRRMKANGELLRLTHLYESQVLGLSPEHMDLGKPALSGPR